jgi:hypothetical protein
MGMLAIAGVSLLLVPLTAPFRQAMIRRMQAVRALALAQGCLRARGWAGSPSGLQVVDIGGRAFRVDVPRGRRGTDRTESVIVPDDETEPLVVVLDEVGPRSNGHSQMLIAREGFRILVYAQAE